MRTERDLIGRHMPFPALRPMRVQMRPHPYWVEAVVAIVVPKPGQALDEATVLAHCGVHLAGFKTPKKVVFAETLPKNPSGKLLKRTLRQAYDGVFIGA